MHENYLFAQLKAACDLWSQIKDCPYPADRFLGNHFHRNRKKFGSRDRRFLSETTYALFRHKSFIESWEKYFGISDTALEVILGAACENLLDEGSFAAVLAQNFPQLRNQAGLYQKLRSRTPPESLKESSGNDWLAARTSFPLWLIEKWEKQFGAEETRDLLEASQKRPPFVIRANTLKIPRLKLLEQLHHQGLDVAATERSENGILFKERANLFNSEEFEEGLFEIQDEGSQLVCERIGAEPGETVWDVCAGGGGKSLALAAGMKNKGRIIATDLRSYKLEELRKRSKRAGITSIFPAELERISETHALKKGVDKIVVDAPCSGTGTLRRNPDAKWKLKPETFLTNQKDQLEILRKAVPYLKPGGKIYYITCSLEPEENEQVFDQLLSEFPSLSLVPCPLSRDGYFRLRPHREGTDGFFLATAENKVGVSAA